MAQPTTRRYREQLLLRVMPGQRDTWREAANAEGCISLSRWIRLVVSEAARAAQAKHGLLLKAKRKTKTKTKAPTKRAA